MTTPYTFHVRTHDPVVIAAFSKCGKNDGSQSQYNELVCLPYGEGNATLFGRAAEYLYDHLIHHLVLLVIDNRTTKVSVETIHHFCQNIIWKGPYSQCHTEAREFIGICDFFNLDLYVTIHT